MPLDIHPFMPWGRELHSRSTPAAFIGWRGLRALLVGSLQKSLQSVSGYCGDPNRDCVLLWLVNTLIPMAAPIKTIINVIVVLFVVLWLLDLFGLLHGGPVIGYHGLAR
jgi:hypothetical protein